ncbi:heavy-metal-associated domain-containing protein [Ponticoccus alexandrii]|uniref:Copper chaperone n=1 Tax=Ponticoccus alexandrii TaxID=1943633 RepID=A0ABX7FBK2_9RHOB|nr:heavy-metal-associated domain-containing protein [Ponticoccus alexandrii]ETA51111.1 heavy metal-binding protein [Rhodobacteraceae bacterium PD-2]QRF67941.1 copper chaperone [Ponticoccus alexandrii]
MKFSVPEMSCGHCTTAIEKAVKAADPRASVACDLSARTVTVDSALEAGAIQAAMKDAGYESQAA